MQHPARCMVWPILGIRYEKKIGGTLCAQRVISTSGAEQTTLKFAAAQLLKGRLYQGGKRFLSIFRRTLQPSTGLLLPITEAPSCMLLVCFLR